MTKAPPAVPAGFFFQIFVGARRRKGDPLKYLLCIIAAFAYTNVHAAAWQPANGHKQIPIWPGVIPDAKSAAGPEDEMSHQSNASDLPAACAKRSGRPGRVFSSLLCGPEEGECTR
jgi:hypothetical protein